MKYYKPFPYHHLLLDLSRYELRPDHEPVFHHFFKATQTLFFTRESLRWPRKTSAFRYILKNCRTLNPVLSHTDSLHAFAQYSYEITFSIVLLTALSLTKTLSLPVRISDEVWSSLF
jgi:hypothetical protein